jgi:hypothetical protein
MITIKFKEHIWLFLLCLVVLISRLPFLDAGYGVEEDSWGIAVAAYHTNLYGVMEASRLPGHPVNEFIYSVFWGYGPWLFNFFSALCSVVCFLLFYLITKKHQLKNNVLAALALTYAPVIYINSTCTIDYVWALMFALAAYYCLVSKKLIWAAVFLGIAVGCRINSAILYIPFLIWWFFQNNNHLSIKQFVLFSGTLGLVCMICFLPIIKVYGWSFFTYSDQFPYPNWPKIIYKASIGVIGLPAVIVLMSLLFLRVIKRGFKVEKNAINTLFFSLLILQIWSYLMLPQKSAYLMLLLPFGILWLRIFFSETAFKVFCLSLIFSSFFMSVNLTDNYRGAHYSNLAVKKTIAGQEVFFDVLTGPIQSDYSKRVNKLNYTREVLLKAEKINYPTVVICGWWFNQLLIQQMELGYQGSVKFAFYLNPTIMENYVLKGYQIYYLKEQDIYNDLFYSFNRTNSLSYPF